jgi:hypothetical protein
VHRRTEIDVAGGFAAAVIGGLAGADQVALVQLRPRSMKKDGVPGPLIVIDTLSF